MSTGDLWLVRSQGAEATAQFRNLLQCCANEGYSVVAVNRTLTDVVLTAKDTNNYQPVEVQLQSNTELSDTPLIEPAKKLEQLSRLTLEQINDTNKIVGSYDIVALRPLNEKIFHSLCADYDFYDILSFDLSEKLPFMLKRNQVYEAIRKGKFFELQYSGMFDANKKRVCLTNCINLIRATKGKNLLVSSGLSSHIYHRSPVDICSLLLTLGMKRERAVKCLNVQGCVRSARYRRSYKGIVSVVASEELKNMLQAIETKKEEAPKQQSQIPPQSKPASEKKLTVRQAFKTKHMKKLQKLEQKLRDRPVNKQIASNQTDKTI